MRAVLILSLLIGLAGCSKQQAEAPHAVVTRESVIELLKTPEMRAATAKGDASYRAWADGQISGVCFVHHTKMHRKWQPVAYGLPMWEDEPKKEEADAHFPFADDGAWSGGCVRTPITEEEVHVCEECTKAFADWKNSHGKKEPNQASEPTAPSGRGSP